MKKQPEQNLQLLLKSAISDLQVTYTNYKTAIIENLQYMWYSDDGEFACLAGLEERNKKIADLGKEVVRLQAKVKEIKNEIKAKEERSDKE